MTAIPADQVPAPARASPPTSAAAGIGTETDGSIVCPSSANGLVGIKPTVGLVSRAGIIPISHSQDTAGPMCRTVRDAAILLGVLTGVDPDDEATAPSAGKSQTDYAQYCDPNGLKGARIGVARKYFGFHDGVDALMEQSLDALKKQGATLIDPADIETFGKFDDSEGYRSSCTSSRPISTPISRASVPTRRSTRSKTSSISTSATARKKCPTLARINSLRRKRRDH